MKTTLLMMLLSLVTLTSVLSQEKIQFGVKGGIHFTNMSLILLEKEYKTGFQLGVLAEIPMGSKFSVQPEILYAGKGAKGKVLLLAHPLFPEVLNEPLTPVAYELDYIEVPILAKIYLVKNLALEVGPSFNFLVNDQIIYEDYTYTDIGENFEFAGILGLSYKTTSGFFGTIRYSNAFTDALESEYSDSINYGFSLGIGYLF